MSRVATTNLTTIDFLKAFALITMVIDHVGFCFFVEDLLNPYGDPHLWFRAVGRLCVPIWFFLIGYALSRDLSPPIWIGAFGLLALHIISGLYILPLNVLFSFIAIRLIIDRLALATFKNWANFAIVMFSCTVLFFQTGMLTEYGTVGIILALTGFVVRHQGADYGLLKYKFLPSIMFWISVIVFASTQWVFFGFAKDQLSFVFIGTAIVMQVLMNLRPHEYPRLAAQLGPNLTWVIQLMGRRTLELYVIHVTIFILIAWLGGFGYPIYGWFDWEWTAPETFIKMRQQLGL